MPTYDYQCRNCGNTIEVIHGMTEEGPAVCELCAGPLRRIIFPSGIIFKGSGFYRTDSRSSSATPSTSSAAASGSTDAPASTAASGDGSGARAGGAKDAGSGKSAPIPKAD